MPLQNRVTPFGNLIATPERGTLMGNRGCLHNDRQQIRREFQLERWIICVLKFKDRNRTVMKPGHYTELFFLDEATAMAAGHRPCAECQRSRFNLFREAWAKANPELTGEKRPAATTVDTFLHSERLNNRVDRPSVKTLPDGTFVTFDESDAYLILDSQLLRWTPAGYETRIAPTTAIPLRILTPASVVRTLKAGYPVELHTSAFERF
jgi:hypothetical protein